MADGQIVSRAEMQQRGRDAFARGVSRANHGMNPWAPGVYDWHLGYDTAADKHHSAAMAKRVLDAAQVVAL